MNRIKRIFAALVVALCVIAPVGKASAQSALGDVLGNVLQGVLSKSNLTVYDICGKWTSKGAAVSFQSDNFLQKAGGMAASGVIENKINPYFEKLGLNGAVLTIEADSTFTLKAKKFTLSGDIKSNGDGTFDFKFKALKKVSLGSVKAYVQKSGNTMDVMFDATKMKSLISGVAKITGISVAKTAASLLDSYEGLCVGISTTKTGDVVMPQGATQNSGLGSVLGNILGGQKNSGTNTTTEEKTPAPAAEKSTGTSSESSNGGSVSSALKDLFKKTNNK
ncbi:MAG: DUF4923 family protein [Muribaculaceae bacterium]|nr:DUF4923 family protein [Muribaculaceae bacterium]